MCVSTDLSYAFLTWALCAAGTNALGAHFGTRTDGARAADASATRAPWRNAGIRTLADATGARARPAVAGARNTLSVGLHAVSQLMQSLSSPSCKRSRSAGCAVAEYKRGDAWTSHGRDSLLVVRGLQARHTAAQNVEWSAIERAWAACAGLSRHSKAPGRCAVTPHRADEREAAY